MAHGRDVDEELFQMALALGLALRELGQTLDSAGVLPIEKFSACLSELALGAEAQKADHSRFLAMWATLLLDIVQTGPASEKAVN
ncbi:hypothetical protein [Novosphingobium sp.]|uniref:hypothetical protein n=1 Tax=Novosphingobium sp. TaxID=1874826 RepID=UPI0026180277|nr:hypothetical protein [Novosphingobium sp.]